MAMRDEGKSEIGDDVRGEVGDESRGEETKIVFLPGERARTNLALLYGGSGRTFQPWAVTGPTERHTGVSGIDEIKSTAARQRRFPPLVAGDVLVGNIH
jgi:hypothetical protein